MWNTFIEKQVEAVLSQPYPQLNFAVATGCIFYLNVLKDFNIEILGLQHNLYDGTHKSCYFVWNSKLVLDYEGKPLKNFRFLWFPTLSPKPLQPKLLKPLE